MATGSEGSAAHTFASRIVAQLHRHTSAAFRIAARLEAWGTTTDPWAGCSTRARPGGLPAVEPRPRLGVPPYLLPAPVVEIKGFHARTASQRSMASITLALYSVEVIPAAHAWAAPPGPML